MSDMPFRSAIDLVRNIKSLRISAREVLELYLSRVDQFNPAINAIVVQQREQARARADLADAALARGENWGPLHGLPMTVKESYNLKGLPTTWGIPAMLGNIAAADALTVQRLTAAGAIVFGKTNVPIDLGDFQSYNEIYGTTNNPWNHLRTPGGSSGGAAAALAAGLTGLEMGSDIGGSIRNPAHFCGVFGHKPSWDLVPSRGHSLGDTRTPVDIAVVGPMARSAGDLELAMRLVAGPDDTDTAGGSGTLLNLVKPVSSLRIGVWHTDPICPPSVDVQGRVEAVALALSKAGAFVDETVRPAFTAEHSYSVFRGLLRAAMTSRLPQPDFDKLMARAQALAPDDQSARAQMLRDQTISVHGWTSLNEARAKLRWAWHEFFQDFDFMITPIMPTSAFAHDHGNFGGRTVAVDGVAQPYFNQMFWAGLAGVALLPATVIPTGPDSQGLPIGVQIIGPMFGDLKTIQLAQFLERQGFAFQAPPAYLPAYL
jgi:amidase